MINQAFENVCERWCLDIKQKAILLGFERNIEVCENILNGKKRVPRGRDFRDRMIYIVGISVGLGELYDDNEAAEIRWLTDIRPEFGGKTPLEYMLEGSMKNIIAVYDRVLDIRGL